jgi:hypothetical protein
MFENIRHATGVKAMESTTTEYDYTVRDGSHIIQYLYNGTGLDPKVQAGTGCAGAFCDLPVALEIWRHKEDARVRALKRGKVQET